MELVNHYYEAHITLPKRALVDKEAVRMGEDMGFHHSIIDGDGDEFASVLTTREVSFEELKTRMIGLMEKIKWTRYKVEAISIDSNIEDAWGLKTNGMA